MLERAIDPVVAKDRNGTEHQFILTASALRRIARRLRELSKSEEDSTVLAVEAVFITVWESRVDKSETDEDAYFDRFVAAHLKDLVKQLHSEHQPEPDPTKPGTTSETLTAPATVG